MTMHNLPALSGKTVKSVTTHNGGGNTEKVRITFKDGSALVFTGVIKVRWEPAPPAIVSAQTTPGSTRRGTKWPGE